jgi:hypothetical protein
MGEKMIAIMGDNPVVMLKAHGVVAAGESVLECFAYAAYVEENARRQYMAMQIGDPYVFSDDEQAACRQSSARRACSRRPGTITGPRFLALVFWLIGTSSNQLNGNCSAICREASQDLLRFVALLLNGAINH